MTEQAEQNIKEVRKALRREKIKVLLFYVVVATFAYGFWLTLFPEILQTYTVYNIIAEHVNTYTVGFVFMIAAVVMVVSFIRSSRTWLLITSSLMVAVWLMFTVAFLLSPPPNTIWVLSALLTCMNFSIARRV